MSYARVEWLADRESPISRAALASAEPARPGIVRDRVGSQTAPVASERPVAERLRVLVVEPAPVLRHIITHALAVRGYCVETATNVSEVERVLAHVEPHIVLTELHLSQDRGESVVQRVRSTARRPVLVVLMSGAPEAELLRRASLLGVDRSFYKARGLHALLELVDRIAAEVLD